MKKFLNVSIAIDDSRNKWIGDESCGLTKFDGDNWTVYDAYNSGLPSDAVFSVAIDGSGNKWIGTYGLVKFDDTNWTVYNASNSGLTSNRTRAIEIDDLSNMWIGNYGLVKYDGTTWIGYNISNSGLPGNSISSIAIDSSGNKWIGTHYDGLAVFKEGGVVAVKDKKPSVSRVPLKISLHRSSSITRISYSVLKSSLVVLKVFDIKGRIVSTLIDSYKQAGKYTVDWDSKKFGAGVYYIKVSTNNGSLIRKMVIVK